MKKFALVLMALCALIVTLGACGGTGTGTVEQLQTETFAVLNEEITTAGETYKDYQKGDGTTAPYGARTEPESEEQTSLTTIIGGDNIVTDNNYPVVTITMKNGGVIKAELYPDKAPNTVNNFISLAKSGYFEGKVFHRAVSGFMIQGGSPRGDGTSVGFNYSIKGEFAGNGFTQNNLKHTRGVLSMARTSLPDSAGCQFFIMHDDAPHLDSQYAAFGMVISGMDVVDQIATSPVRGDTLINKPAIKRVTVDTKGVDYPEPVTIKN